MKVLTVRHPYAWGIDKGLKKTEFRSWKPPVDLKTFAIHVGASYFSDDVDSFAMDHGLDANSEAWLDQLWSTRSCLLCVVRIVRVREDDDGGFAWDIERVRGLRHVKRKGQLRLWNL